MAIDRNAIFDALYARLQATITAKRFGRIFLGQSQLNNLSESTALFLCKGNEQTEQPRGMPPRYKLEADVYFFARVIESDPNQAPAIPLNTFCDELEDALKLAPDESPDPAAMFAHNPDLQYGTTLGGLCTSCIIQGGLIVEEGTLGQWGFVYAPLLITVTG